ncbi:hypothetical protein [Flavobacterium sp. WC2429]|uniref:Uncharacterized protein n=1 Tax=Flavobacterium sp. WC2429 TaxID=3234140 RepID=A0AB39WKD9_9FLAO
MESTEISQIKTLLKSQFEKDLFDASLENLKEKNNKIRFNNFAYSIRELSRHFLHNLSPDEEVQKCVWYKNETEIAGQISRGERIKYAIQGGLTDKFVDEEIIEIETIIQRKKEIKDCVEILNKYTHINLKTFDVSQVNIDRYTEQILSAFKNFAETIENTHNIIIDELYEKIQDEFIQHSLYEIADSVDILATHHNLEEISPTKYHISKIESKTMKIETDGVVYVRLQWGSNSDLRKDIGAEMHTSFPFNCNINVEINKTLEDATVEIEDFLIDTSDWYE